jgi:hypothetical protein
VIEFAGSLAEFVGTREKRKTWRFGIENVQTWRPAAGETLSKPYWRRNRFLAINLLL